MKLHWLVLWSLWAARFVQQPTLPVRVRSGWLQGTYSPDGSYKQYLAIPYATHPEKRFQAPGPAPTWRGVFAAVEEYVRCPQRFGTTFTNGQEDCLILNVYTPADATSTLKYPVMAYIHGGGFYEGSSSKFLYGPDYLVGKGVILVVFNYRINVQGFACLRIKEAPGNAGMKDQVAALKWIQQNIKEFGGDPDNVTIFGESAGAGSVSLHIASRMSSGLFHKAIMQSGSSIASWITQFRPVYMAELVTRTMGYDVQDPYEIYKILMNKPDAELIETRVPRKESNIIISELLHSPCIESEIDGEEEFLTDLPHNILTKGAYNKVPIILGTNSAEGLLFIGMENDTTVPKIKFEKSIPKDLHIPSENIRKEVAMELQKLYMNGEIISFSNLGNLSKFYGDIYFTYPVLEETELYLESNDKPVFSYLFNYDGWRNFAKLQLASRTLWDVPGATHADDIFYLFKQPLLPSLFENKMINRMTTMWTNFAKYGDPVPVQSDLLPIKWMPANRSHPQSLIIDEQLSYGPLYYSDALKYLRGVYSLYRRKQD